MEDQQKLIVPLTRETETLTYNTRMIIDCAVEVEARAWLISKINRVSPNGIVRVTLAQDTYDQHNDYIERDDDGNIIGMWANYWNNTVDPTPVIPGEPAPPSSISSVIKCSGKPQIKVGGSPKTFAVSYYDENGGEIAHAAGAWSVSIDGSSVAADVATITLLEEGAKIRVDFKGDDSYIGKILTVTNTQNEATASLDVAIIAL